MIKEHPNEADSFPDTREGWKARAAYFESLYKIEKLESAKLRAANRSLTDRLYKRSSEKLNDLQRVLFGMAGESGHEPAPLSEAAQALIKEARKGVHDRGGDEPKRRRKTRDWDRFAHLPQQVELVNPPPEERVGKVWATEEVTEHVEHIPGRIIRHITVRPVWVDPKRISPPVIAPLPPELKVFPGSMYGLNFMINVVLGKFADHLPLYRQAGIDARSGVWVSRQARMRIVDNTAHLLITIAEQIKAKILRSGYLHIDETITKVLDPERRGRSHDAYLWGFLAPHEKALYIKFEPKRVEKTLFDFFPVGWKGDVQTDGLELYPRAFNDMPFVRHFECVGHLRRYVLEAMEANEHEMTPILKDITELYRIERLAKRLQLDHERRAGLRHLYAKPVLKRLQKAFWKLEHDPTKAVRLEGKGLEAVTYANAVGKTKIKADSGANRRWRRLALYAKLGNGHVSIDQNAVENTFRSKKIGRKNWMFIAHP